MLEDRKNKAHLSWQTRLICSYIAATNPPGEGESNVLLEAAEKITLDPVELKSISEKQNDDNSSERPVKYADANALALFAQGLTRGPV